MATYIQLLNTKIHMENIPMVQKLSLEAALVMEEPFVIRNRSFCQGGNWSEIFPLIGINIKALSHHI